MARTFAVFIDALKPESLEHMNFLRSFNSRRVRTNLGYSNTCHASMYTGVYPNKHQSWFIWRYSQDSSPFKLLRRIGKYKHLNNTYLKFVSYFTLQFFSRRERRRQIAGGLPLLVNQPLSNWSYFDPGMISFTNEPNSDIGGYPTIFKILRENRIAVGYHFCSKLTSIGKIIRKVIASYPRQDDRFDIVFIGELDALSHKYGQDSPRTIKELELLDKALEQGYRELSEKSPDFCFLLWSDHGQVKVESSVNLYDIFNVAGKSLTDYVHFVDSSFARFWFRNEKERLEIEEILSQLNDKGYILNREFLKRYHLDMPHDDYGQLIYYLDRPYIFASGKLTIFGKDETSQVVSHHSFLPDYPDMDGIFLANRVLSKKLETHINLESICASIMDLYDLEIPEYMDGVPVWSR
ncbi:alkaline phosphatase family protein [Chloroflexota bacterium]